jgi:biopolymer transport protein ExbD
MNFRRHRRDRIELNMAPMIDVVFLLLIFFMVTTTFEREAVLKIQLPQARGQKQDPKRALEIVVDAEGRYYLNQHELADQRVETLKRALAKALEEGASPMVVIAADRKTPHQAVIRVLDAARQLHLHRVAFATRISTEE